MQDANRLIFWHWLKSIEADNVYRKQRSYNKTVISMKIALVITELDPGGAERNLVKLATGCSRLGHEVTVVSIGPVPKNEALPLTLERAGVAVIYLNCRFIWFFAIAVIKLRFVLRRLNPDVIQSFLFHANMLTTISNANRVPHYVGLRVRDPREGRYRRLARYSSRWSGIICVSRDVEDYVRRFFDESSTPIYTIGNGVDRIAVKEAALNVWPSDLPEAEEPIVFIGRLDRQKGIDTLLKATPKLLDHFEKRQLYVIGDGPLKLNIEEAVKKLDSKNRIHITGYRDDALTILSRAKLFLFPSRWEGMPNVIMEAMALGIPVCSTPVDGVIELLGSESKQVYGREAWGVAAFEMLRLEPEQLQSMGTYNSSVIENRFTVEKMVGQYLDTYQRDNCHV